MRFGSNIGEFFLSQIRRGIRLAGIVPGATRIVPGATGIVPGTTGIVPGTTGIVPGAVFVGRPGIAPGRKAELRGQRAKLTHTAWLLLIALLIAGCEGEISHHGYVASDVALEQIQVGSAKEQVDIIMGTPSATSSLGRDVYYYVSSTKRRLLFFAPKVIDRRVLAFHFDKAQRVSKIANYGLKDGKLFDYISRTTPTRGDDLTAVREIFGNIGSISPGGGGGGVSGI